MSLNWPCFPCSLCTRKISIAIMTIWFQQVTRLEIQKVLWHNWILQGSKIMCSRSGMLVCSVVQNIGHVPELSSSVYSTNWLNRPWHTVIETRYRFTVLKTHPAIAEAYQFPQSHILLGMNESLIDKLIDKPTLLFHMQLTLSYWNTDTVVHEYHRFKTWGFRYKRAHR